MDLESASRILEGQEVEGVHPGHLQAIQEMFPEARNMNSEEIDQLLRNRHHLESIAIPKSEVKYVIRLKKSMEDKPESDVTPPAAAAKDRLRAWLKNAIKEQN